MRTFLRRLITFAVAMLAVAPTLAQAPAPALAAATIYVDDNAANNGSVKCPGTGNLTIQQGVDAATAPGSTVVVCPGAYPDPVLISGRTNFKLIAKGDVYLRTGAGFTGPLVYVFNSTKTTLQGLTIDGNGSLGATPAQAILFQESSGSIQKNNILNWHGSGAPTVLHQAINVETTTGKSVKIDQNTIFDFEVYGIYVINRTGTTISRNLLVATGGWSYYPNGILMHTASAGTIIKNTFRSDDDIAHDPTSTIGVFLRESSHITVKGNTFTGWNTGVAITQDCTYNSDASHNTISGNKFNDVEFGVSVSTFWASPCGFTADHTTITGNKFNRHNFLNLPYAVTLQATAPSSINGTIIKKNTFTGYPDILFYETGAVTGTVKSPNKRSLLPKPGV